MPKLKWKRLLSLCALTLVLLCATGLKNATIAEQLLSLEQVTGLQSISQEDPVFREKYIVIFKQPLDPADPTAGYLQQRVELGYQSADAPTVMRIGGYELNTENSLYDDRNELAVTYNTNYVNVEYRYYGASVPEGLDCDSTGLWQYLTDENATEDFHRIRTALGTLLQGSWLISGESKGGTAVNLYCSYYPGDAAAWVSYVSFNVNGTGDTRFCQNIYESIGDTVYGPEQAALYRDEVLRFQVACIEEREYLQAEYRRLGESMNYTYREACTPELMFDTAVLLYAVQLWQYAESFEGLEAVLAMPREDDPATEEDEHALYRQALLNELFDKITPNNFASNNRRQIAYLLQNCSEDGAYYMDFSWLRAALAEAGTGAELAVTPELEEGLLFRLQLTEEQQAAFHYSSHVYDRLNSWSETTEANVLLIYGQADTWYPLRLQETANESIHVYASAEYPHTARIAYLPLEDRQEILSLLDSWLPDGHRD